MYLSLKTVAAHVAEMEHALRSLALSAQAESPAVQCAVYTEVGDPAAICYVEDWPDAEGLSNRVRSTGFLRLLTIMESSSTKPVLEFRFVDKVRGLDYVEEMRLARPGQERSR